MKIKFRIERPTAEGPEVVETEIELDGEKTVSEISALVQSVLLDVLLINQNTSPPKSGGIKGLLDWRNRKS